MAIAREPDSIRTRMPGWEFLLLDEPAPVASAEQFVQGTAQFAQTRLAVAFQQIVQTLRHSSTVPFERCQRSRRAPLVTPQIRHRFDQILVSVENQARGSPPDVLQ